MESLNMPTQKSVGHDSHAASINNFNLQMRQQPWYQDWFKQQKLDPNNVKLSKGQRQGLEQLILQKGGVPHDAFNDMMIDPAGNLNTEHGFASQPTWLKALEIAGAAGVGGYYAAPYLAGAGTTAAPGATVAAGGTTAAATAVPTIASTAIGTGMGVAPSIASATTLAGGVTSAGAGGGFSALASKYATQKGVGAMGKMLQGASQASADNRGAQIAAGLDRDKINIDRSVEDRATQDDAWHKLQQASYMQGRQNYTPATINGRQLPSFGFGPKASTPDELAGADALKAEMLKRLQGGSTLPPMTNVDKLSKPGAFERIANYAGPALQYFGGR